jgi:hypothetical protein
VFSLRVERNDLPDDYFISKSMEATEQQDINLTNDEFDEKIWMIGHRYEEFYALEDKLRDYYGSALRLSTLPDRKTTLQLLRLGSNGRILMESHRTNFERFLQQLLQQVKCFTKLFFQLTHF